MLYLISYDLSKKNSEEYNELFETIKSGSSWWHYLESTWIIKSKKDLEYWHEKIKSTISDDDSYIIVDITKQKRKGWLPKKAWNWLRENDGVD